MGITFKVETITPDQAAKVLEKHKNFRRLNMPHAEHFKRAIEFAVQCFPGARAKFTRSALTTVWARAWLSNPEDEGRLAEAAIKYLDMQFGVKDHPLRLLAKYASIGSTGARANQEDDYMRAASAVRQWLDGGSPKKLYRASRDPFPLSHRYEVRNRVIGEPVSGKAEDEDEQKTTVSRGSMKLEAAL